MDSPARNDTLEDTRRWLDRSIEAAWLLAIFAVPLVFAPPGWFSYFEVPKVVLARTAAAAIVVLWAADLALAAWRGRTISPRSAITNLRGWLRDEPVRWAAVAAAAYLAWVALSAAFSAVPGIAVWGYEYGRDGLSLVSIASTLVVFLAIASRLHRRSQAVRLVSVIVASAILESTYAMLQNLGVDPYDLSRLFPGRVIGTLLNPIFLASTLLQSVPLLVVAGVVLWGRSGRLLLGTVAGAGLGFVLLIIVLTSARGPWVGTAASLAALAVLLAALRDRRALMRSAFVGGTALVVLVAGLAITPTPEGGGALDATLDRLGTYEGAVTGDVSGRTTIWRASRELVVGRPWFGFENGQPAIVRHLFGYGPDTFLYVYPLEADPVPTGTIKLVKDGHNLWVHAAVETGVPGAVLLLAVFGVAIIMGTTGVVWRWRRWPMGYRLLAAALVASIIGRGVEQVVGVAQISDALLSWSILGLLVALPRVVAGPKTQSVGRTKANVPRRVWSTGLAAVVIIVVAGFGWAHAWGNLRGAAYAAASVNVERDERDTLRSIELMQSAIEHTPASAAYRLRAASLFDRVRLANEEIDDAVLIEGALEVLRDGLHYNRLSLLLQARTGETLMDLVRRGETDLAEDAARHFERGAYLFPNVRSTQRTAAARLLELGMYERALPWTERTLVLSSAGDDVVDALALKASALAGIGRHGDAIDVWRQAIAEQPTGPLVQAIEANILELERLRAGDL